MSYEYGAPLVPGANSTFVSVIGSNSATYTAKISISNSPSGNGYYQQLITISDPAQYGINPKGSNFEIVYSNGTPAYSWIQSINQGTQHNITVWSKLANGTSSVDLEVYPSFENLLSSTGYIGEAPQLSATYAQYDNGIYIFGNIMQSGSLGAFGYENFLGTGTGYPAYPETFTATPNGEYFSYIHHQGDYFDFSHLTFSGNETIMTSAYAYTPNGTAVDNYFVPVYNNLQYFNMNGSLNVAVAYGGNNEFAAPQGYSPDYIETFYITYFFSLPYYAMPSISIGSAQPFLSNGTEITHQPHGIVNPYVYNPTQEYYTYDIQDSFNYNYITVIYNSSWQLVYPSITANTTGTLPASIGGGSYMQFNDISGVITIAITFLEYNT